MSDALSRTRAVCPGTYDPATLGHLDVIRRAAAIFDEVIVGVVGNPGHKAPMFTAAQRVDFLRESLADIPNTEVEVFRTLVVEFARERGAKVLVKGLRAISDFEWELQMSSLNAGLAPEIETLYLMSSPNYSFVSSSGVREIATHGGDVSRYVPPQVAAALEETVRQASRAGGN